VPVRWVKVTGSGSGGGGDGLPAASAEWHHGLVLLTTATHTKNNQRILHELSCMSEGKP
jgi:hypothetical protein